MAALSPEARHRPTTLLLLDDGMTGMGAVAVRKKAVMREAPAETTSKKLMLQVVLLCTLLCIGLGAVITLAACDHHMTSCSWRPPLLSSTRYSLLHDHSTAPAATSKTAAPGSAQPEPPYAAEREIQWESIAAAGAAATTTTSRSVALLNFNSAEVAQWRKRSNSDLVLVVVRLRPAHSTVTWDALYPEWIDEDAEEGSPTRPRCPSLPDFDHDLPAPFDLVAVKLPCNKQNGSWSRDVARLHLQLSAAKLALLHSTSSASSDSEPAQVLIVSECLPLPNLFPCRHLVRRDGDAWLYSPDASYLRDRIRLPVGSCELSVSGSGSASGHTVITRAANYKEEARQKQAYATVLHSSDAYVCGAIAAAQSIRLAGSTRELVALVDEGSIGAEQRAGLVAAGWQVRPMERIRNPRAVRGAYNEWNYSKLRLWQLTDYDRVVFVDADLLVLRNIDFLFDQALPEVSATGNNGPLFNSGVMVVEPCNCTFEMLMSRVGEIESYNGGDQGYLNEVFTWWHRMPRRLNVLKYYRDREEEADAEERRRRLVEEAYAVHYLGIKPWLCFRDYDCNWNVPWLRRFASDEAHARWWAVHDRIALARRFCALPARQKAALEFDRRQAERANATDRHWARTLTDPRLGPWA